MNKYNTLRLLMLEAGLAKINLNITKPDGSYCTWNIPMENYCRNTFISG